MIDLALLSALHFLRPWWLVLLVPVTWIFFRLRQSDAQGSQANKIIADHLLQALTINGGNKHWFNPANMGLMLLALSVLLMAGPTWQQKASPFVQDQAVLVVALDLSNTMNQTDIQPSRLDRAKQKIEDLLLLRGNARTGLIAYAGSAHQVIPLTNDPDIIRQFLAALDSRMMPKPGKFPEAVIPLADQMLRDASAPGTLLMIGDGVGPNSAEQFDRYFSDAPYQLLVLGIGLTELSEGQLADQQFGGAHLALQDNALKELASAANGSYQRTSADKSDVQRINRLIDHHLAAVGDSDLPWVDAGYFLLYPISLMFLLWFRQGWTLNACLALFFIQSLSISQPTFAEPQSGHIRASVFDRIGDGFLDLWLSPDQQGRYYFEKGDYQHAARKFKNPAWQGTAYYYAENFAAAAELFTQIDSPAGRFNLANALAQGQHYVAAVKVYSQVLAEQADHADALKNRAFVQQIIDDINRMSASQQTEAGEVTRELGDAPQRADGAEQEDIADQQTEQLTAEQLLTEQHIHDMWMRQVQADPARFLGAKFNVQYHRQTAVDAKLEGAGR